MDELDPRKFLEKYRNTNVDFYRFPGNYGDALIANGTKKLLKDLNISANYVDIDSPKNNDVLLIDGGGNLVDYYPEVREFLTKKHNLYSEIVILPHTIFGLKQIDVLNKLSGNLTVFCREKVTFDFVKNNLTKGNVYLWHDCAFYITLPKYPRGEGILNAFRTDVESTRESPPNSNNDISTHGNQTNSLDDMINSLKPYEEINTDRLHIAICAALLGKKVNLFPNSYYKNEAIFDYSLRKFPNVFFKTKTDE